MVKGCVLELVKCGESHPRDQRTTVGLPLSPYGPASETPNNKRREGERMLFSAN